MNGLHIPGSPIVVDFWRLKDVPPRCLFFLTHMHADHTSGLTSSWSHPIHCTPTTAKLLKKKFGINPKLVVELEVDESRILYVNCPGSGNPVAITVTVFDANHCPGAAMFLFEGFFGSVLYTGDFRISLAMMDHPALNGSRTIDVLYLDNTYCHPSCLFPSREEATDKLVSLVQNNPEFTVVIGMHTLGKEDLLVRIATSVGCWIGVSPERYDTLKLLELPNVFNTEMESCPVQVYPFHMVAKNTLTWLNTDNPVMTVLPTCLYVGEGAPLPPVGQFRMVIPYSDHCSFSELRQFVASVRPRFVRPIVRNFTGDRNSITIFRTNMAIFDDLLDPTPPSNQNVPEGIQKVLSMRLHEQVSHPHPTSNTPALRKHYSITPPYRRPFRNRPKGVQFVSPSKPKCKGSRLSKQGDSQASSLDSLTSNATTSPHMDKDSISSKMEGSPAGSDMGEVLNRRFKQAPLEACEDDSQEMETGVSDQVNPLSHAEGGRTQTDLTLEGAQGPSDLLVSMENNDNRTGVEKMAELEEIARTGGGFVQERVVTYCHGLAMSLLPKMASSEDLDHFYSNDSSKLAVKRKLPPTITGTPRKRVITPSLHSEPQTQLERYFSPALQDDVHVPGENTVPLPQAAHLTAASVANPETLSRTEARVMDVESPIPSTWPSSEKEKRTGGDVDTKATESFTSAAQCKAFKCTCGENGSGKVCLVGLEFLYTGVRNKHQPTEDRKFDAWLRQL